MEDWKQVEDGGFTFQDKEWDHSEIHLSSLHDPSEHWKPTLEMTSSSSSHHHQQQHQHHRQSVDEPETYNRNIHATLIEKETCADHVIQVWNEISKVIVEKLKEGYGVKIAGLGTFTYYLDKDKEGIHSRKSTTTTMSQNYCLGVKTKKIPIMILSPFVVRMYKLVTPFQESLSDVPIVSLNLAPVIAKTRLPRKIVDGIITEVLQSFARAVVCGKNVEFPFPFIGKLQISDRRVVFKFYAEFCHQLDFDLNLGQVDPTETDPLIVNGVMTPLRRHIPSPDFRSVFHLREVRSVHQHDLLAPVKRLQSGKYVTTSGLGGDGDGDQPVLTMIEDGSLRRPFTAKNLYEPSSLRHRLTISWVRGKRDYTKKIDGGSGSQGHWPPHHFHVVGSGVALRANSSSISLGGSMTRPTTTAEVYEEAVDDGRLDGPEMT